MSDSNRRINLDDRETIAIGIVRIIVVHHPSFHRVFHIMII